MGRPIKKGSTDQSTTIRILDSTTFLPETAVEYDTAGIDLWYRREQETKTSITEAALAALDSAHSDGGIEHIGDGYYRLDLPDAVVAAGSGENSVQIGGTITGMVVIGNEHALVDYDPYDTVRLGLTALPNAIPDASGGLPVTGTRLASIPWNGSWDTEVQSECTDALTAYAPNTVVPDPAGTAATPAEVATALTNYDGPTRSELTTDTNSIITQINANETKIDTLVTDVAAILVDTGTTLNDFVDSLETRIPDTISLAAINAQMDTALSDIHLDHLLAADYDPTSKPGVATALFNELIENDGGVSRFTENSLEQAPSGTGASAATIADAVWDEAQADHVGAGTFGVVASEVDAIKERTDNLPDDPADDSDIDTQLAAIAGYLDTEVTAILADTQDIQSRIPAALVSGRMSSDAVAISGSTDAADKHEASAETIVMGAAATGTLSTTEMTTDLTISVNDQYNGRILIFRSDTTTAALRGQATDITDTVTTDGKLTFTTLTTAPANGDTFVIV